MVEFKHHICFSDKLVIHLFKDCQIAMLWWGDFLFPEDPGLFEVVLAKIFFLGYLEPEIELVCRARNS